MGWMENYGLLGADDWCDAARCLASSKPGRVTFERLKLAQTLPTDLEAAEVQHAFEDRIHGLRMQMINQENEKLGQLLKQAADMPCGIVVVRGVKWDVDSDEIVATEKTVMGFHPSVPAGEVQYITSDRDVRSIDWDVLDRQLVKLGGEHGGAGSESGVDGVGRGDATGRTGVDHQAVGAVELGRPGAGEDAGDGPSRDDRTDPAS